MTFETELRESLRRKPAPPEILEGVMRRIATPAANRPLRRPLAGILGLAASVMIVVTGYTAHYIEQRREGERAKAQLMLALRLTSQKLQETQQHLQR